MSHTKGPWEKNDGSLRVQVKDNPCVAICYTDTFGTSGEAAGNAHLIAASPDLLESLVKMVRLIVELYPGHVEPEPEHVGEYQAVWGAVMESRAAIAKAEGK